MAFKIYSTDDNRVPGIEYLPASAITPKVGMALTQTTAATSIKLGDKVTLHTDGLQVTATTTNGVAEVVYMDGTASGSMCRVRF